jgi:hypothetical protein
MVQIRRHDAFVGAGLTQQVFPMPYATMSALLILTVAVGFATVILGGYEVARLIGAML